MAVETQVTIDEAKVEAFLGQVVSDGGAALSMLLAHVGDRLGLWEALADLGAATPNALSEATGTNERMVREWLNAQAAGGYVAYDAEAGTYALPAEHAFALTSEHSPVGLGGIFQVIASSYRSVDRVIEAMRTGKGLGWGDHHPDLFEGVERGLAPVYRTALTTEWIPALEGVEERLTAGRARVADVGCGHGASTLLMAETYPGIEITGFDLHEPSIETARIRAGQAGLAERVSFEVAPAQELPGEGYDLVMLCECLHDMADPLGAVRRAAKVLAPGGTVMLVEPTAADRLEDNLHTLGRWFYSASTVFCTPCSLADDGAALGAQAGEARLRAIFHEAGFAHFRRAAESPFNTVYEARLS